VSGGYPRSLHLCILRQLPNRLHIFTLKLDLRTVRVLPDSSDRAASWDWDDYIFQWRMSVHREHMEGEGTYNWGVRRGSKRGRFGSQWSCTYLRSLAVYPITQGSSESSPLRNGEGPGASRSLRRQLGSEVWNSRIVRPFVEICGCVKKRTVQPRAPEPAVNKPRSPHLVLAPHRRTRSSRSPIRTD
jgi:hypothetical protein